MRKNRLTIGLLVSNFFDSYNCVIWKQFCKAGKKKDINILAFMGGPIKSNFFSFKQRNIIYDMVHTKGIDGIAILSGSIGVQASQNDIEEFLNRFLDIPLISIGIPTNNVHSIEIDNKTGMYDLVTHFISEHERKRIAFISGPEGNAEARDRLAAYKKALTEHGIPIDPLLIIPGTFDSVYGKEAIESLYDKRKVTFDALIGANDYMALNAMKELQRRNIKVPLEVSVGGFDNIVDTRFTSPTLTTVNQPFEYLGQRALDLLLDLVEKKEVDKRTILPSHLVTRKSRGCLHEIQKGFKISCKGNSKDNEPVTLQGYCADNFDMFYHYLSNLFLLLQNEHIVKNWLEKIIEGLLADWKNKEYLQLRSDLQFLILQMIDFDLDLLLFNNFIMYFTENLLTICVNEEEEKFINKIEKRMKQTIWESAIRVQGHLHKEEQKLVARNQILNQAFINIHSFKELQDLIETNMIQININQFLLCMYESNLNRNNIKLVIASAEYNDVPEGMIHESYPLLDFVPEILKKISPSFSGIIFPLFYKDRQFGFSYCESGDLNGNIYEQLIGQLSRVISGINLFMDIQNHAKELEEKVKEKTDDLRKINEQLRREIDERKCTSDALEKRNLEIEELNKRLKHKSRRDHLTQLYNREAFFELLALEMNRSNRNRRRNEKEQENETVLLKDGEEHKSLKKDSGNNVPAHIGSFSILMIDIDNFKRVNDTYGHLFGDNVLIKLSALISSKLILRREDFAARYGGEEFLLVLPNTSSGNAYLVAERLANKFRAINFAESEEDPLYITLSIGITELLPMDVDMIELIKRADLALYYAKEHGRNQTIIYENIIKEK